ncbi:hypothetical protein [Criblamydia sequanensis]|uniref:Uncharacterized protein n=1 Tax=Candidatus Criblamydia sequanensis CRIB-18 TaxID=1437425 RepID=A0A090CXY9_9BACT|nr:hypothetical protein [Criblamydia sequanensis]CDR32986.1 hypothetical protein CSEC_0146 [Criblamydia sequanensis CRIB-18]
MLQTFSGYSLALPNQTSTEKTIAKKLMKLNKLALSYRENNFKIEILSNRVFEFYNYLLTHQPETESLSNIHEIQSNLIMVACLEHRITEENLDIQGSHVFYSHLAFFNSLSGPSVTSAINRLLADLSDSPKLSIINIILNDLFTELAKLSKPYLKTLAKVEALRILEKKSHNLDLKHFEFSPVFEQITEKITIDFQKRKIALIPLGWALPKPYSGHHFFGLVTPSHTEGKLKIDLINAQTKSRITIDAIDQSDFRKVVRILLNLLLPQFSYEKIRANAGEDFSNANSEFFIDKDTLEDAYTKQIYGAFAKIGRKETVNSSFQATKIKPSPACTITTFKPLVLTIVDQACNKFQFKLDEKEIRIIKLVVKNIFLSFKESLLRNVNIHKSLALQQIYSFSEIDRRLHLIQQSLIEDQVKIIELLVRMQKPPFDNK